MQQVSRLKTLKRHAESVSAFHNQHKLFMKNIKYLFLSLTLVFCVSIYAQDPVVDEEIVAAQNVEGVNAEGIAEDDHGIRQRSG